MPGVGIAIPDALQEFRVKRLKEMGSNAIRTAHNPPAPELLDACDRLGMLVLDENRLMGINQEHLDCLERFMKRDRNHPSVVLWSLGNEEWAIESNIKGARVGTTMQAFAQRLDSSRAFTAAISGGWDDGTGMVMQVMGYNYIVQGDIDEHHKKFPWQAGIGTEESNTVGTRGIYVSDDSKAHMAPDYARKCRHRSRLEVLFCTSFLVRTFLLDRLRLSGRNESVRLACGQFAVWNS